MAVKRFKNDGTFEYVPALGPALRVVSTGAQAALQTDENGTVLPAMIISSTAPSDADGAPNGTIYIQTS